MLDKISKLSKETAIYAISNSINKLIGFILIPVYAKYIPISDYGVLAVFEITITFLITILNFGIISGHQRFFYIEKENNTYGQFLFSIFISLFVLCGISILIFLINSSTLSKILTGENNYKELFNITMYITFTEILFLLPLQILQFERKPLFYLLLNSVKLLLTLTLTIYFIIYLRMSISGILHARLIGNILITFLSFIIIILPRLKFKINLNKIFITLKYGFPLIFSSISFLIFQMSDRYMLNWLSTQDETGKYSFGLKIANTINLTIIQAIGLSYVPTIYKYENDVNNKRYYSKSLTYYFFSVGLIALTFLYIYEDIIKLLVNNNDYLEGFKVVPILTFNFFVLGMNYFLSTGIYLKNKTRFFIIPSTMTAVLNIILNYYLIPIFGMMGASIATLISQISYVVILTIISNKIYSIKFEWNKIFLLLLIFITSFTGIEIIKIKSFLLLYTFKIIILTLIPLILFKLKFFEDVEINALKNIFSKFIPTFIIKFFEKHGIF